MSDYQPGHVKRDPVSGVIALRTIFPEEADMAAYAWLVATTNAGARSARTEDVEGWDDIYVPEV